MEKIMEAKTIEDVAKQFEEFKKLLKNPIRMPTGTLEEIKENKVWVTFSYNVNLGNYENIKIESGYSQTVKENEDPLNLLEEMQDNISSVVIGAAKNLKKQLKPKRKNG
jgi:hypothetical protein